MQCCLSQRAALGGSGWTDISGLDARWATGALIPGVAVGLLRIWPRLGERIEAALQQKPQETGVAGGVGNPPGGAFDLDRVLPPADGSFFPPTSQLSLVGFLLLVGKLRF